jgi:hypothetical protein
LTRVERRTPTGTQTARKRTLHLDDEAQMRAAVELVIDGVDPPG